MTNEQQNQDVINVNGQIIEGVKSYVYLEKLKALNKQCQKAEINRNVKLQSNSK